MTSDMRSCPYCGNSTFNNPDIYLELGSVFCPTCGLHGPNVRHVHLDIDQKVTPELLWNHFAAPDLRTFHDKPIAPGVYWRVSNISILICYCYQNISKEWMLFTLGSDKAEYIPEDDICRWYGPLPLPNGWKEIRDQIEAKIQKQKEEEEEAKRRKQAEEEERQRKIAEEAEAYLRSQECKKLMKKHECTEEMILHLLWPRDRDFTLLVSQAQKTYNKLAEGKNICSVTISGCRQEDFTRHSKLLRIPYDRLPEVIQERFRVLLRQKNFDRNYVILEWYFLQAKSVAVIAEQLGLTTTTISNIIARYLRCTYYRDRETIDNFLDLYYSLPEYAQEDMPTAKNYVSSVMDSFVHVNQ